MTASNDRSSVQKVYFSCRKAERKGCENYSYHWPMRAHHPLHCTCLNRSSSRAKVAATKSVEGEPSDKAIFTSIVGIFVLCIALKAATALWHGTRAQFLNIFFTTLTGNSWRISLDPKHQIQLCALGCRSKYLHPSESFSWHKRERFNLFWCAMQLYLRVNFRGKLLTAFIRCT